MTNLYDNNIYFGITFDGETTLVIEPDKWDTIQNHIARDPTFFGFWSDFLEDKYGMMFTFIIEKDYSGGASLLRNIYENYGSEAEVYFEVGYRISNTLKRINQWRINLNEYTIDFGGVTSSIEKMPFQSKLRSRMNTPVTLNDYANMDGELLTPISNVNLRMHSKTLLETTECLSNTIQIGGEFFDSGGNAYNIIFQPDLSNLSPNELKEVFTQPFGLFNTGLSGGDSYTCDIFTQQISQYISQTNGNLKVNFSGKFNFIWNAGYAPSEVNQWNLTPRISVQRLVNGTWMIVQTAWGGTQVLDSSYSGWTFPYDITTMPYLLPSLTSAHARENCALIPDIQWNHEFNNIQVQIGDNIYIELYCVNTINNTAGHDELHIQGYKYTNDLKLEQLTSLPSSTAPAYRIFDVLNQQLESITGQKDSLISPFFSDGGFGRKYALINGYGIRNFGGNAYRFRKDFGSTIADLQAVFCLGVGIKKIDNIEYVVIDELKNFYKTVSIGSYYETLEWKDNHSSKYCFNNVELGFTKYRGLNILQQDEFCTEGSYLLQYLKINNNTLTKKSGIIASGYLIEEQRRNQFISNQQQSLQNDDDIFIIATSEPCIFEGQYISFTTNVRDLIIQFSINMILKLGDTVVISFGGSLGDLSFSIRGEVSGYPQFAVFPAPCDAYYLYYFGDWVFGMTAHLGTIVYYGGIIYICKVPISPSLNNPSIDPTHWENILLISGVFDIRVIPPSPDQIFCERNQPFEVCANVIDPATIYNGRLSLKHILFNWRPFLGVGLSPIQIGSNDYVSSKIVTTMAIMNSEFTTKYLASEQNKGNVGDLILVEIAREFVRDFVKNGSNIFSPLGFKCKIRLGWNDIDLIRQALCGETGDATKDFGGLTLSDGFGEIWFCHVDDIKYNFVTEIAEITGQKVVRLAPTTF